MAANLTSQSKQRHGVPPTIFSLDRRSEHSGAPGLWKRTIRAVNWLQVWDGTGGTGGCPNRIRVWWMTVLI